MRLFRRRARTGGATSALNKSVAAPDQLVRPKNRARRNARGPVYSPEPGSPLTVVDVNGKPYVAGLTWLALTRYTNYMTEARELGKKRGMDMVAIRRGSQLQAGFAPKTRGKLRGMYSLAAALCGVLGPDCIAAFELANGRYVMVAVIRNTVMAGRDFVGSLDEVRREVSDALQLASEDAAGQWHGRIVAPPEILEGAETASLADLLPPASAKPEFRLRQLTLGLTRGELIALASGLAVICMGTVALLQWRTAVDEREAAELAQLNLAQELERAQREKNDVVLPWEVTAGASSFTRACQTAIGELPLSVGGWILREAICDLQRVAATYARPEGGTTVAVFVEAATHTFGQTPAVIADGAGASIFTTINLTPNGPESLQPMASALSAVTSYLQQMQGIAEGQLATPPEPLVVPGETAPPAPEWKHRTLTVTTGLSPIDLVDGLPPNGLRITEIHLVLDQDAGALTWNITGDIYGR